MTTTAAESAKASAATTPAAITTMFVRRTTRVATTAAAAPKPRAATTPPPVTTTRAILTQPTPLPVLPRWARFDQGCSNDTYYWGAWNERRYCAPCASGRTSYGCAAPCDPIAQRHQSAAICHRVCERGRFRAARLLHGANKQACVDCPPGKYQELEGQVKCNICPRGFYQPYKRSRSCDECPVGKFAAHRATSWCSVCGQDCGPGHHVVELLPFVWVWKQQPCAQCCGTGLIRGESVSHYTPGPHVRCSQMPPRLCDVTVADCGPVFHHVRLWAAHTRTLYTPRC